MFFYLIILFVVFVQFIISDIYKKNDKSTQKIITFFIYILLVLYAGLRYKVGVDTYNYMNKHEEVPFFNDIEFNNIFSYPLPPLFLIFSSLIKTIFGNEFYYVQIFHAAFINYAIFKFIYKNTKFPFLYITLYLITFYLYFNFEIMKESSAVAVFLLSYNYALNKKYLKFYLCVAIAFLFHSSAIVLIFAPFVRNIKFNYKLIIYILSIIFLLSFSEKYLNLLMINEGMGGKVDAYNSIKDDLNINWIMLQILHLSIVPLLLMYLVRNRISANYTPFIYMYFLFGIGVIYYQVVFLRFSNYFFPFLILYCVNIIGGGFSDSIKKVSTSKTSLLIILLVFAYNYNFFRNEQIIRWFPYSSVLNERDYKERENLFYELNKSW